MVEKGVAKRFLETKWFGLVIGLGVFGLMALFTFVIPAFRGLERKILDMNFRLRTLTEPTQETEGVSYKIKNPRVSDDIVIVGVDERALQEFDRWPFPRYRHADLLKKLARISNQDERERAVFLDFIFTEPDTINPQDDAILVSAIRENGRTYVETIFPDQVGTDALASTRVETQRKLGERFKHPQNITGDWKKLPSSLAIKPPLTPYGEAAQGNGHVSFLDDPDKVFRHASLIMGVAEPVEEIAIEDLTTGYPLDETVFERLTWSDKERRSHDVEMPLTDASIKKLREQMEKNAPPRMVDNDGDGSEETEVYILTKYRMTWVPTIPLSLAADYLNVRLSDVEVMLGDSIRFPAPQLFNQATKSWEPYSVAKRPGKLNRAGEIVRPEIRETLANLDIPIDDQGRMLINYMGPRSSSVFGAPSTYTARSFYRFASNPPGIDPSTWEDESRGVAGKIVMVGAFSAGMAADEKTTPYGLMFGVELLANSLNTIIMDVPLNPAPLGMALLVLFGAIMLVALLTSRISTIWALVALLFVSLADFLVVSIVFDEALLVLPLTPVIAGMFLTFLGVVAYRIVFEEKDKRRTKASFSKIVGPGVLEEIMDNPPEPGGEDKDLTVLFSDIRDFSKISEMMESQQLLEYLNRYLSVMADIVKDYNGTLDKYIGDAVMSFWGAPAKQDDHALLASKCALKMMAELETLNEAWRQEGQKEIDIGIGINTGKMTVGFMGSKDRLSYTVIGDAVNLGSRLEGMNKKYYKKDPDPKINADHFSRIIISDSTYEAIKDVAIARELDLVKPVGKEKPSVIHELIEIPGGIQPPKPPASKGRMLHAAAKADRRASVEKDKAAAKAAAKAALQSRKG